MARKFQGKRLVVDASVAGSCGGGNATAPTPKNCREFLKKLAEHKHSVVVTIELNQEWKDHASKYAKQWMSQMRRRSRVVAVKEHHVDELWSHFEDCIKGSRNKAEAIKDLHLLEAALLKDQRIVSLDENTARKFYTKAASELTLISSIVWVNPDKSEETPLLWLAAGAPAEPQRMLGYRPEENG